MLPLGQLALLLVVVVVVAVVVKRGVWDDWAVIEGHADEDEKRGLVTGLAATKRFRAMCNRTFDQFDLDGSGDVCPTEAYVMVLYIYIKINKMVKVCPPTKEQCDALFKHFDLDDVRSPTPLRRDARCAWRLPYVSYIYTTSALGVP